MNCVTLFDQQVKNTPDNIAVIDALNQLTYSELNSRVNDLAQHLRNNGITKGEYVPICFEKSADMVIAILALLKLGAVYIPLDTNIPQERVDFIISDIKPKIVVADSNLSYDFDNLVKVICTDENEFAAGSGEKFETEKINPDDSAYIIYTSGTTGNPKGVIIPHGSLLNLINYQISYFNISETERILQFSNYSFDASVEQIFISLLSGAALCIPSEEYIRNISLLNTFINEHEITHIHATPGFLALLKDADYKRVKRIVSGGEACPLSLAQNFSSKYEFYNEYGPTETTVTSLIYKFNGQEQAVPIGKPIAGTHIYIYDENMNVVQDNMPGEMLIGGKGLAKGYLNNDDQTSRSFVTVGEIPEILYKTGDIVRKLSDGNFEFIGRKDNQVKINGYRIELEEIESVLNTLPSVEKSAVILKNNAESKHLIAFVSLKEMGSQRSAEEALLIALEEKLPTYMIPQKIVQLQEIPLTPIGKVDRRQLENIDLGNNKFENYLAPASPTELKLAELWKSILKIDKVDKRDTFIGSGGDSLKSILLINAIEKSFNVNIDLSKLFIYNELAELGNYIDLLTNEQYSSENYENIEI